MGPTQISPAFAGRALAAIRTASLASDVSASTLTDSFENGRSPTMYHSVPWALPMHGQSFVYGPGEQRLKHRLFRLVYGKSRLRRSFAEASRASFRRFSASIRICSLLSRRGPLLFATYSFQRLTSAGSLGGTAAGRALSLLSKSAHRSRSTSSTDDPLPMRPTVLADHHAVEGNPHDRLIVATSRASRW